MRISILIQGFKGLMKTDIKINSVVEQCAYSKVSLLLFDCSERRREKRKRKGEQLWEISFSFLGTLDITVELPCSELRHKN